MVQEVDIVREIIRKRLNVLAWNTALYNESTFNEKNEKFGQVIKYVKRHLEKENPIAFLQEIPYVSKDTWKKHSLFLELLKEFPEDRYNIRYNIFTEKQIMMTVAISIKDNTGLTDEKIYSNEKASNREIAVLFNDLNILGIHAKNGTENKAYLESLPDEADIILGDFNAGNYSDSENSAVFNNILKEHVCICNMPTRVDPNTKKRTCIDHVFVKRNLVSKCSKLIVDEDIEVSDHFPLSFEIML